MSVITLGRVNLRPVPWRTVGLLAVLGLLFALAAAVYVGSQQQRVPPPFGAAANGLVAYSKDGDIYTVDPIAGTRSAIITGATVDASPAFSLDGTRLAFVRTTGTDSVVVVADADGGNQVVIPMTPLANAFTPAWSSDRRLIAVTAETGDTGMLSIVDAVAQTARTIDGVVTDAPDVYWRPPDGGQLAVVARVSGSLGIVLVSPRDDRVDVLTPVAPVGGGLRPGGWTPDGSRFAYAGGDGQVHVLDVDSELDVVVRPSVSGNGGGFPRFSNDGRRIVFMEWGSGDESWLSVAASDGSEPTVRVSDVFHVAIGTHYTWSPDDTAIVLEPQFGGARVLLDPDGGPASTPPWMTDEIQSWQRLAP